MADAEYPRSQDPDDWFADPGGRAAADKVDEWLADSPRRGAGSGGYRPPLRVSPRTAVAVAVVLVAIIFIALALGGAFSSGGSPPAANTNPPPTTTAPPPTTTVSPPASHVAVPTTPLKPGDTGTQVKLLQRALLRLAYYSGKVDGDYGPATVEAVKTFQLAAKLTSDGIAGPQTLRALKSAVARG